MFFMVSALRLTLMQAHKHKVARPEGDLSSFRVLRTKEAQPILQGHCSKC